VAVFLIAYDLVNERRGTHDYQTHLRLFVKPTIKPAASRSCGVSRPTSSSANLDERARTLQARSVTSRRVAGESSAACGCHSGRVWRLYTLQPRT
jgi:hypothetical protein